MGIVRNIGLLILLAAFAAGGFFVKDFLVQFEQLKAYKEEPEYASLPESVKIRISDGEEKIEELKEEQIEAQEEIKELKEELEKVKEDNVKYFEEIKTLNEKQEALEAETEKKEEILNKTEEKVAEKTQEVKKDVTTNKTPQTEEKAVIN